MEDGKEHAGAKARRSLAAPAEPERILHAGHAGRLPASEFASVKPAIKEALQPVLDAAKAETGQRGWLEFKYIMGYGPYVYRCWQEDSGRCNAYLGRIDRNGRFVPVRSRNRGAAGEETR